MTPEEARAKLNEIIQETWGDISFGLGQQTVLYACGFGIGDCTASPENIAVCEQAFYVPETAIATAALQYGAAYRATGSHWEACARYNAGPSASWDDLPTENQANYARAWDESAAYVTEEAPEEGEQPVAEFLMGFADLAAALGADVVGEPLADEYQLGPTRRQPTTKGEMIWTDGGPALFLAGQSG